jgi:hypothetical protein
MSQSYSFAFKVTQIPSKHHNKTLETCISNTKRMAFMAMLRAIAANPSQFIDMNDEEFRDFKDEKMEGIVYRIQFHKINL